MFGGCLYQGRDFSTVPVKDIKINTTTQREIFNNFGEPEQRGLENGYETWTYSYAHYEFGQISRAKDLYVVFNPDRTVRSYSFNER